jgi:two-component system, chemotaxis family, CheB/CheR fusion protein
MTAKLTADDNKPGANFPIVGIGASAGGLNSLQCFLAALPKEFDFAIIFVQHLSTKHKSLLPGLLHSRRPDLQIEEISEGMEVLPGRIYLCTPGTEVRVEQGTFHVDPPPEGHVHLAIDEFFASLAEYAGERAIAVIFSGAGTDGARGVQAVRTAGGTVFVQEPATAEFPGMPTSAISTGRADGVLPPDDIAREILKLRGAGPAVADKEITPAQFDTFSRLIHEKTGYHFNHYKRSVVGRRIKRRIYLRGVSTIQDYITLVAENDSEAASLAADLMIGVTSFFRDRLAWKALRMEVIRRLVTAENGQPVRAWTPACATGEEAYSIAMMLRHELDLAGRNREVQVFATDVNDGALEKAREGKYPGSISADVQPDYMKKFFTCSEDGQSVIIGKEIRESVLFARQDLLTDPPFSRLDLIICRNLLIYLEPDAQEKCIALFHYALKEGGYLFLGNAESTGRNKTLFRSLGHKKCRVYQKIETGTPSRLSLSVPFAPERGPAFSSRQTPVAENQQSLVEFLQENLLEEYAPAAVAINQNFEVLYHNGPTNRYLQQPRGGPTGNLLELLPKNLGTRIRGAVYRSAQGGKPVSVRTIIPDDNERKRQVTLRISRLRDDLFLVVFRLKGDKKGGFSEGAETVSSEAAVDEDVVRQLEGELSATRADLQNNIEQLKSLNEEMQSSNEEFQAANEELETSREELQSLNEELITVNSQLQQKIEEQEETNNDLNNFLASANIPTVFLDHQFRVRRFTPAMSKLIKLIPGDVGRPIADMSQEHLGPDLIADSQAVLDHLSPVRKELRIGDTWYIRATLPYRTSDNRIEGVVITYTDTSDLKSAEERTRHLASFPQLNPNPVMELDSSGKVTYSNMATQEILEGLDLDKGDPSLFLPADLDDILKDLAKKTESTLRREIAIKDRIFGESVHIVPQFDAVRIYAFDITESKRGEEMRGRLSAIVQSAEDAIISKDLDGVVTTWNVGAEEIFGYKAEEVIGKNISFLIPPGHIDEVPDILKLIAHGEHIARFETERIRKDGTVIPVSLTFSPIKDANGRVVGVSKIAHDISTSKETEKALRESEGRLRTALESAEMGTWAVDLERRIVHWDVRCRTIFGLPERESVPLDDALSRIVEDDRALVRERIEAALDPSSDGKYDIEYRVAGIGDRLQWIRATGQTFFEGSGERRHATRFIGVVMDMTERRRAEEEVLRAKQDQERHAAQLQTILDNLTEGLVVADLEANLFHWNPAAVAMHGFADVEECRRKLPEFADIFELSTAEDGILPLDQWPLARILRGETLRDWEVHIRRHGTGWHRVFSYGGTLARDREGNPLLAVVTVADVTERKRAETELLRLNETLKALSDSSQAVIRAEGESDYMDEVCRIVVEDCGYSMVWIGFVEDDEAKSVRPVAYSGFEDGYLETLQITWADTEHGRGPTGMAIRTGKVTVCPNILTDPAFAPWREEAVRRGYASSIVFPLMTADRKAFGAVTIYSEEADPFSEGEVKLLAELADDLAYGITALRMGAAREMAEEALKKSLGRFELLTGTAGILLQSTEPQKAVESVCRKVMQYLECDAFFNFFVDEKAGKLHLNASAGIPDEEAKRMEWLDFGVAVCGCAARDAARIVAEHIPSNPDQRTDLVKSYGITAYCCHPLLGPGGKVIGTLSFGTRSRETFSEEDLSLMKAVADQVAAAMIRMRNEAAVLKLGEDMAARNVELESVNKELESFIYSISHDLRAPLRSMGGFAKILVEDYLDSLDAQGRDYLGRIINGSEKMTLLIDDLLHLSKISREEVQRTKVDMSRLANSVVAGLREADPQRSVEVAVAPELTAFADPRLMEIVLSNLLANAWKFTSRTGSARIEFGAFERDGKTVFYVKDNGAGFDPQYAEKMFSPFHRLHSTNEYEGTGIGLTIVDRIIRRHGGTVWADGVVGRGAAVYFTAG